MPAMTAMTAITSGGLRDGAAQVEPKRVKTSKKAPPVMVQNGSSGLVLPQWYSNVTLVSCISTAWGTSPHAIMSPDALSVHTVGNTVAAVARGKITVTSITHGPVV